MEEPQLSDTVNDMSTEESKTESSEVPNEAEAVENATVQPESMEVDEEPPLPPAENAESTPSADMEIAGGSSASIPVDETVPSEIMQDDTDDLPINAGEPSSPVQEANEADVTTQSVDFTERSINFSQLDMDQTGDESSDAFDALKRNESDALGQSNEEQSQTNEPAKADDEIDENKESGPKSVATSTDDDNSRLDDIDVPMSQDDGADLPPNDADNDESNDKQDPEPEPEQAESEHEDGEGIDENIQLLADDVEETEGPSNLDQSASTQSTQSATEGVIELNSDDEDDITKAMEVEQEDELEDEPEEEERLLKENEILEFKGEDSQPCLNCENETRCIFKVLEESGEIRFLCSMNCVNEHREDNPDKYTFTEKVKKIQIVGMKPSEQSCVQCSESKECNFKFDSEIIQPPEENATEDDTETPKETTKKTEIKYFCSKDCVTSFIGENTDKYMVRQLKSQVKVEDSAAKVCARTDAEAECAKIERENSMIRRCAQCTRAVGVSNNTVQWETMDFCDEYCLKAYQSVVCEKCSKCSDYVTESNMGKYCVRFGFEIHQFCSAKCLNEFKNSFQPCTVCSKNLKTNETRIQVFKKGTNKFCSRQCVRRYDEIVQKREKLPERPCFVCNETKPLELTVLLDGDVLRLCSHPCLSAFKFVNNVEPDECNMCKRYFERRSMNNFTHFELSRNAQPKIFCTKECFSVYIVKNRSIMQCDWCKVSKYSFDLISTQQGKKKMCSIACDFTSKAPKKPTITIRNVTNQSTTCASCHSKKGTQYTLGMSDSTQRFFCTYQCVLTFQASFAKAKANGENPEVVPSGIAKRAQLDTTKWAKPQPVISHVQSLRRPGRPSNKLTMHQLLYPDEPYNPTVRRPADIPVPECSVRLEKLDRVPSRVKIVHENGQMRFEERPPTPPRVVYEHKTQVVTIPECPKEVRNKSTMCKALTLNKGTNCVPETTDSACQTDDWLENRFILPLPIPIFIPMPMYMYSLPAPIPVPFPIQVPTPVFIPTTRNSSQGIMKEIKKIQDKMPTDPYEAELLMMAEMVAGESNKRREDTDQSESDEENNIGYNDGMGNNNYNNDDLVQMAFKMASSNEYGGVDLESEMTANTIASSPYGSDLDPHSLNQHQLMLLQQQRDNVAMGNRRGKRMAPVKQQPTRSAAANKRIKREEEIPREPAEKPDAHLCLKYTFGVNAWKQWVTTKNAELEKSSIRRKPIKSEILQLTADELNYSLCMFVKEVRKPNGAEYAPDTIYYLVLGELRL